MIPDFIRPAHYLQQNHIEYAATKKALLEHMQFSPLKLMSEQVDLGMAPVPVALPSVVAA